MSHNQAVTDSLGALSAQANMAKKENARLLVQLAVHLRVEHGMSLKKIATRLGIKYGEVLKWHKAGLFNV